MDRCTVMSSRGACSRRRRSIAAGTAAALAAAASLVVAPGAAASVAGRIAFAAGLPPYGGATFAPDIYTMGADGAGRRQLTTDPAADRHPAWSPNGRQITFHSYRDGDGEIYVMNDDGTEVRQLTQNTGAQDRAPDWSPDGTEIAFESDRDDPNYEIYVMSLAAPGRPVRRLTTNADEDYRPDWSPDGDQLAFHSKRGGNWDVYRMDPQGLGQTPLTTNPAVDSYPAWSSTGLIAFISNRNPVGQGVQNDIYVTNRAGSFERRLTDDPAEDAGPAWPTVGEEMAFESNRTGDYEIYRMTARRPPQRLTNDPALDDVEAAWWAPEPGKDGGAARSKP